MSYSKFYINPFKVGYKIKINREDIKKAEEFSIKIINQDNQYNRLMPRFINPKNIKNTNKIRIQRTTVGKLGEIAFYKLLKSKNKNVDISKMFEIYEGQNAVDDSDFTTLSGDLIDVKTAYFSNHKKLMINLEQFNSKNKKIDYYVGVKLHAENENPRIHLIDLYSIDYALIYGYAKRDYLENHCEVINFGEGDTVSEYLERLLRIDELIEEM
ncbi:hypothetical protein [Anaerococcus sp.]|uniref:hypothetical protein n=1 Tax=Anaerococcus sp. TaxID=1872515 RepID=UPI00280B3063|nr:hypothetical protein [Anaerococcus sp.]MDU3176671.1 hypothetical protein [Anaerococcus sp.]